MRTLYYLTINIYLLYYSALKAFLVPLALDLDSYICLIIAKRRL